MKAPAREGGGGAGARRASGGLSAPVAPAGIPSPGGGGLASAVKPPQSPARSGFGQDRRWNFDAMNDRPPRMERRLSAILVADIAGYSTLMGSDEARTVRDLKEHQAVVLPMIGQFGGRVIDTAGDGILAEFGSVVNAVECALAVQETMAQRNQAIEQHRRMHYRIGINQGDVVFDAARVYGDGINVAARIEGIAEPGGICVSAKVRDEVQGKVDLAYEDIGEQRLKNIAQPVRIFRVTGPGAHRAGPSPGPEGGRHAAASRPSIAVLAFNNMSGDPEQEYFSDGISEDIITDLSQLSELHVIARNSSFTYKQGAVSVPDVGKALGVRYVLEGSVRKAGNRVRVTAQLIDSTTGGHVWASRFDRDLTDIFAVQDELTQKIVEALKLKLTDREQDRLAHKRAVDFAAYELFLRGREQSWLHTKTANLAAHGLLERALSIDAGYVAAQARIAFVHVIDYVNGWTRDPETSLRTGLEMARQAVAMDPDEPQGHFALSIACMWSRSLDEALAEAARCVALSPNMPEGYLAAAHAHIFAGEAPAALGMLDAYMRLDPLYPDIALYFLAQARFALGEFALAAAALEQRIEKNPRSETSFALLASCYGHLGRPAEGRVAWEEALRIDPGFSIDRRRSVLPFRNPADFELRVEGLRTIGLAV